MPEKSKQLANSLSKWIGSDIQKANWDSYGASPIDTRTILAAMQVAERIADLTFDGRTIDRVEPCNDGSITLSDDDESIWIRIETEQ